MSNAFRAFTALSLAFALAACGQMSASKDKTGEAETPAAESAATDGDAKPEGDKPPTPAAAPAGAEPNKPS